MKPDDFKSRLDPVIATWSLALSTGNEAQVAAVVPEMIERLSSWRSALPPMVWDEVCLDLRSSALMPQLLQDPMTCRSHLRPQGLVSDARLFDLIHGRGPGLAALREASERGRRIAAALLARPFCRAIRMGRLMIAEALRGALVGRSQPSILTVGAGHLPEIDFDFVAACHPDARILALDEDPAALDHLAQTRPQVEARAISETFGIGELLSGQDFDFVCLPLLANALPGDAVRTLLLDILPRLAPGGRLLLGNFAPDAADRGYLEAFMGWKLIYRDEAALRQLARRAARNGTARVYRDPGRQIVFLDVTVTG